MKRKILSSFLTFCLVMSLLSICSVNVAAAEPVSDATIANRIDELCYLLNGKYFNTYQDFSCGAKVPPYNHGCVNCDTSQIVKAQWFKDMFGTVKSSQFVSSGRSCVGFAWFAEWYIFRANNSDTVRRDKILKGAEFNYENVKNNAHIGDYFWLGGQHAVIYISCDSDGITVLDCNGSGTYNCLVQKRTISYSKYSKFDISRCYSITNGRSNAPAVPTPDIPQNPEKFCTVTFDSTGGSIDTNTITVLEGAAISTLPVPTRSGYTFRFWGTSKDGASTTIVTESNSYMFTSSSTLTLYALWEEDSTTLPPISNDLYTLTPKCAGKMRLDVAGASVNDKANVQIYSSNDTTAQQWEFTYLSNGYYKITSKVSGKALDVAGASAEAGANVQQYTPNGTNAQQWMLKDAGDGYYYIIPRVNTDLCLDVAGAGTVNKTNVGIYTANGTDAQKWKLTSVSSNANGNKSTWGPWSSWSTTPYSASSTRDVETKQVKVSDAYTEYRYGRYVDGTGKNAGFCTATLAKLGYSGMTVQYSAWTTSKYPTKEKDWTCGICGGPHIGVHHYSADGRAWWKEYVSPQSGNYFWEESRQTDAVYETQYRYRDKISS